MTDLRLVRQVTGAWNRSERQVCLRLHTDETSRTDDFCMVIDDIQPLVSLLLQLSGRFQGTDVTIRQVAPLKPNAVGIGETEDGEHVLQIEVGPTTLAFQLPPAMSRKLGYALITVGGSTPGGVPN
ncbi:MAG: hypothetical protein AB7O43_22425 [Hyphomicrobiaceae bacterium]